MNNINHFNFYFTGFLSPMSFFSGTVFPAVRLTRNLTLSRFSAVLWLDLAFLILVSVIATW